uniref:Sodium-coupled monocarboxylate transporter 1 n=1 Tax=Anopheles culicifacies TaxID=139723 RepID=A0A182LWM8_9DIPT
MHSINLDNCEGEGLAKPMQSNLSPVADCIIEDVDTTREDRLDETDENDNSSKSQQIVQMSSSTCERIFHSTDRVPERKSSSLLSSPGPSSSLKQLEMKRDTPTSPSGSPHSNIIFHRTYNKKPSPSVSRGNALENGSPSLLPTTLRPVICVEDIRLRIGLPNRHGNVLFRSDMSSHTADDVPTSRLNNSQSCIIRRSFHKESLMTYGIAKIRLEQDTSRSDGGKEGSRKRASYSYDKKDRHSAQPAFNSEKPAVENEQPSAEEGMEVCEESVDRGQEFGTCNAEEEAVEASSMANSYGDEDSSGWSKHFSTQHSLAHRRHASTDDGQPTALSEFDLMLQKINQSVPPMSHLDRIDQWRVTAEDLLHSIPTKAQIETSSTWSCAKRPYYYDAADGSSDEDSDTLDDTAGGSAAPGDPCTSTGLQRSVKKRRPIDDGGEPSGSSNTGIAYPMAATLQLENGDGENDAKGLDFRKSQVNPEIDKPTKVNGAPSESIRILTRKNYYKLPTRYRAGMESERDGEQMEESDHTDTNMSCADRRYKANNPYAYLLSRDEEEREKFLQYLRISPVFRTDGQQVATGTRTREQVEKSNGLNGAGVIEPSASVHPINGISSSKPKTKPRPKVKQNKRKPTSKHRTHPSIIASSGLRGVRRLVLSSSLRSGKVIRYRNSRTNERPLVKPRRRPETKTIPTAPSVEKKHPEPEVSPGKDLEQSEKNVPDTETDQQVAASLPSTSTSTLMGKKGKSTTQRHRCSVDSAVSSSTSAEMHEQQQLSNRSKECQTIESIPPEQAPAPVAIVNEGKRMRNPLNRADGEVLHLFLLDEQLVVVQKELVSFWRYSRLSLFLGVKQEWQRRAQIRRWNHDTEVDMQNARRIVLNKQDPIYLEPRARNLSEDKSRICPLASIYVNAYFLDTVAVAKVTKVSDGNVPIAAGDDTVDENAAEEFDEIVRLKSFQLDTVKSSLDDIRFIPLPNTRDFLICWHEHLSQLESRTGLCKYSLTPDIQTLACIRDFMPVKQKLSTIKCINDKKLVGMGHTTIHIWCYESGFILHTVDLKLELGINICCFLHIEENNDNTLLMLQMQQSDDPATSFSRRLVKVIALNLYKATWYIAHSYEIALASKSITSESQQWALDEIYGCHRQCVTFDSGELLMVSLNDPTVCWTNHQRLQKDLQRAENGSLHIYSRLRSNDGGCDLYRPRERILNAGHWNGGRDLVFLSDQFLTVKTIDEYMVEEARLPLNVVAQSNIRAASRNRITTTRARGERVESKSMASGRSTLAESLRELYQFSVVDYCMFGAMLILSAACGIYFGFFRRNKSGDTETPESSSSDDESAHRTVVTGAGRSRAKTTFGSSTMDEYLLGSRKLKAFPVAMSLVAGYISGVTILGTPAEIYNFGTQYWLIVIPILLMGVAVCTIYLPVFCSLKLNSSYEYLELRFNSYVRSIASVMFVIDELLFLPMIIYVPALAFNQVTGFNLYVIGAIVCVVCIFYTLLGGIKAVVFTDAWQVVVMFISVVVVVIIGTIAIGGPDVIWDRSVEGGRIDFFNFNPSMYERQTFWAVLIGGFFYWTSFNSVNQTMVQRYMSLPNLKKAKLSIAMFTVGMGVFVSVCCYAGLLLYGKYYECDPATVGLVTTDDQLFPHYVMESVGKLKGIPGLFIAGVFGAALSSLSVVLNSTSAVLLEDILKGLFRVNPTPFVANVFVRGSVVVLGLAAMGCLFIIEKLGGILSVATSLSAIAAGTTCGIFTLGMLIPWSNTKGALFGGVSGALLSGWVSLGSQFAGAAGEIVPHKLPVSVSGCIEDLVTNVTMVNPIYPDESSVFPLYRLSYHWITPIGVVTVLIVGTVVSFITGPRDLRHIDPELISPVIHRFLPQESFGNFGTASKNSTSGPAVFSEEMQPHTNVTSSAANGIPYGSTVERNGQMDSDSNSLLDSLRELYQFGVTDYCMFAAMLILSAACGIYYGFYKRARSDTTPTVATPDSPGANQPTTVEATADNRIASPFGSSTMDEYLLGSRKLKPFPVAMSLVAGYISGVTILGTPAEIYNFGTQYWLIVVPIVLTGVAVCTIYLPVFCSLKLNSSYEYLELRFHKHVRSIASLMFVIDQGGIKAVVFTDAWQVVVMFISVVVVIIIGVIKIGGPSVIWERSVEGGRIDFLNLSPSMYERQTFWAVLIGGFFYWTSFNSVNQTMVQRYMSLPNLKTARLSIALFTVAMGVFVSVCCYAGLLLYGMYYDCDPALMGLVTTNDQLFPHYVMESVGHLRGMPGLFIAGVFGAALSSMSVILNSVSAVLLEDVLGGLLGVKLKSLHANIFVRCCVVILGLTALGCLFIIDKLDGILIVSATLAAIANGTTGGIFTLGMLVPWSNTKGALFGGIAGALLSGWISLGSQFASAAGQIVAHKLPVSVDGCIEDLVANTTNVNPIYPDESGVFPLYRLSYHWITPIGVTTVLVVGTIISFITGPRDLRYIDPELISPMSFPRSTMSDAIREMYQFGVVDYCMFGAMLFLSAACGIYYGFFKRTIATSTDDPEDEQDYLPEDVISAKKSANTFGSATIDEYLLGSRKLKAFPVAMSLLAGYISGVTILGTPAEIYNFGTQYWLIAVPILLMGVAVCSVYLPVFCSLKLNSSYEYLELRFNPYVRSMASIMFVINQGGIKAVVFTDAWQVVVMFISVVVVVIIGTIALGGPEVIWDRAVEGGRIDFFNFNPSMYERQTFWAVLIGGFFYWTSYNAVNQTMVQRYMSLPNLRTAKFSIYMFVVGTAIFVSVCCYTGLLLYGKYYDCDPATVELVTTSDQLFPHYVMESVGNLRGMPGLFIAGVFGAALSSLSVILNTTSGVLLEDILKGLFRVTPSSFVANIVVRGSVVVLGLGAMGCLFIVDKLDGILIVSATLAAIGNGTTGGMFTLGMLVPWSNTKGALFGGIAGALLSGWISLGSQFASAAGKIVPHKLPVSVDGCIAELITNTTIVNPIYPDESGVFPLYRLSYHWITPIGVTTVVLVGSIISFITGPRDLRHIDPELISPVIHRFLPRESFSYYGTANKNPPTLSTEMQTQTNVPGDNNIRYGSSNEHNGRMQK